MCRVIRTPQNSVQTIQQGHRMINNPSLGHWPDSTRFNYNFRSHKVQRQKRRKRDGCGTEFRGIRLLDGLKKSRIEKCIPYHLISNPAKFELLILLIYFSMPGPRTRQLKPDSGKWSPNKANEAPSDFWSAPKPITCSPSIRNASNYTTM